MMLPTPRRKVRRPPPGLGGGGDGGAGRGGGGAGLGGGCTGGHDFSSLGLRGIGTQLRVDEGFPVGHQFRLPRGARAGRFPREFALPAR